jgi:hypothetical protein
VLRDLRFDAPVGSALLDLLRGLGYVVEPTSETERVEALRILIVEMFDLRML